MEPTLKWSRSGLKQQITLSPFSLTFWSAENGRRFKKFLGVLRKQRKSVSCSNPRMAPGILSVQASSVATESAFNKKRRIIMTTENNTTCTVLEMCMCLKDHLDAHERRQHTTPLELPLDVEEGVFNDEVQMNEATQLTDQEIALDASSEQLFRRTTSR
ncbi:putative AC transposase [Tanacetum coccineum]